MKKPLAGIVLLSQLWVAGCSPAPKEQATETPSAAAAGEAPNDLKVTLELLPGVAGAAPRPGQTRTRLTLTNTGGEVLPARGWKLFFNGAAMQATDTTIAQVRQYNGDLHYLTPGSRFKPLAAKDSTSLEVVSRPVRNRTDFPVGFYLVRDDAPEKGLPVAVAIQPNAYFDQSEKILAAKIFDQNATIAPVSDDQLTKIFPTPVAYQEKGAPFVLDARVNITTANDFRQEAEGLAEALAPALGKKPAIGAGSDGKGIILRKDAAIPAEGYELSVNPERIQLSASTAAGMFYGIQSLKILLPAAAFAGKVDSITLPGLEVKDAPRFAYRGFMMDMARNFQPKSQVLKVLDAMALYKMNTFHFHFSEDEGWRLEIPSLPELTAVGATRAHTPDGKKSLPPSYGSGPDAANPAGTGFYRRADFVEILKYARDRHITVIPEIESPGHARAAIKAMDARYERFMREGNQAEAERYRLRDPRDESAYRSIQGWDDNVMDVSLPSTYAFLERVVDDLREMYREAGAPLQTIHFGGDEVPAGVWEKSPAVRKLMAGNPAVKNTDDLWYYYFGKVNELLKARNLFLSGWEEIGLKKEVRDGKVDWVPNPAFTGQHFRVNVWKNSPGSGAEDLAYRMANAGYKVVLTCVTHLYLDLAYNPSYHEPGQYWGGYVDVDKPFYFIPYDYLKNLKEDDRGNPIDRSVIKSRQALTAAGRANIVGIEAPLWSETNRTPAQFEYKMLPKLLGVAERAWAKDPAWATEKDAAKSAQLYNRAWSGFVHTVGKRELPRLDHYAGGYGYRVPGAGAKVTGGKVVANVQFPGLVIRYTTDGTEPTAQSPVYGAPIALDKTVKLKVFTPAGRSGQTVTVTP